jgi:acyl-CoA hydrolase
VRDATGSVLDANAAYARNERLSMHVYVHVVQQHMRHQQQTIIRKPIM